ACTTNPRQLRPATARRRLRMATEQLTDLRGHILAAAEHIIRERGLRAATTRAIATEAGCAEGTIYRYFPDKAALVVECVRSRFADFLELLATLLDLTGKVS